MPRVVGRHESVLTRFSPWTAISVLLTGVLSMVLFGTELSVEYALGMTNVLAAVFLYNAQDLEALWVGRRRACRRPRHALQLYGRSRQMKARARFARHRADADAGRHRRDTATTRA